MNDTQLNNINDLAGSVNETIGFMNKWNLSYD